jgi:hypothetical protein
MPRELIEPHKCDKRFVSRESPSHFADRQTDVSRSLASDRRSRYKTIAIRGDGDRDRSCGG